MGEWAKRFKAEIAAVIATLINGILTLSSHSEYSTLAPGIGFSITALICKACIRKDIQKAKQEFQNIHTTNKEELYKTLESVKESRNPDGTPLFPSLIKKIEEKIIAMHDDQQLKVSDAAEKIKRLERDDNQLSDDIERSVKEEISRKEDKK